MLTLPYGTSYLGTHVPAVEFRLMELPESASRCDAMDSLVNHSGLKKYLHKGTLCLVNDATRPTRTRDVIEACGFDGDFLVATGAHSMPSDEEIRWILGHEIARSRVSIHSALSSPCIDLGTTPRGTPVSLNAKIFDYPRILIIGSVEPHYFAGYTGGRKGILPGVASFRTIEANHALYFRPGAEILRLRGNPVHEDMIDAVSCLNIPIYTINMVLDASNEISGIFCGELEPCHLEAAGLARSIYAFPLEEQSDTVVTCAHYPMDVDLYQAQKALYNASLATKPGGTIILISQCRNGIGPRAFYDLLSSFDSPEEVIEYAGSNYVLGYHKAANFAGLQRDFRIVVVSDLPAESLHRVHLEARSPSQIDTLLREELEAGHTVACMPQGSITVPTGNLALDTGEDIIARS